MEALLRRHRDTLLIVGQGNLLFGIWGVIRTVMTYILQSSEREKLIADFRSSPEYRPDLESLFYIIFFALMFLLLLGELLLRLYIYRAARAEAEGEHRRGLYIVLAGVMAVTAVVLQIVSVVTGQYKDMDLFDLSVTLMIELTSSILLLDLVRSAIRVRQLERKLANGG